MSKAAIVEAVKPITASRKRDQRFLRLSAMMVDSDYARETAE